MRGKYTVFFIVMIFTLCICSPLSAASEPNTKTLTIQNALDLAYKNNTDLKKAQLDLENAQDSADDASEGIYYIPTNGLVLPTVQSQVNGYQQAQIALAAAKKTVTASKSSLAYNVVKAYNDVITANNDVESTRMDLAESKEQKRVASLSKDLGLTTQLDYETLTDNITAAEEGLKAKEEQYKLKCTALALLLGEEQNWQPTLASRAILSQYPREALSLEMGRSVSESILILQKQSQYEIEQSKTQWILPNIDSDTQLRNVEIAGIDLEQAKDDARTTIEQLYYAINATEKQVAINRDTLNRAERDLKIGELKYSLGMLPKISLSSTGESITSLRNDAVDARLDVENSCADLATYKAQFAYITGNTVFEDKDWSSANSTANQSTNK